MRGRAARGVALKCSGADFVSDQSSLKAEYSQHGRIGA